MTVGELLAAFLDANGVRSAFGVVSVHNMPLLDALSRRGTIRYVSARGEAGTVNMADAYARVSGELGVAFTSTGTGAGNACGALIEASTAKTPLLHITGQVQTDYIDRGCGDVHEAKDQLGMLRAASKAAFRIPTADAALGVLREAVRLARAAPCGPVSVEIPIDVQSARLAFEPADLRVPPPQPLVPEADALDALAAELRGAKRPMLWLGGGARHAGVAVRRLLDLGFGVVTTMNGRGVVDEDDPRSLGSFAQQPAIEAFYRTCDAMLIAGSLIHVAETARFELALPARRFRIDVDAGVEGRGYSSERFVLGDALLALHALADRLGGALQTDPAFHRDLAAAREKAAATLRTNIAPYDRVCDALQEVAGSAFGWVRDVTISNATWGSRLFRLHAPGESAHATGGGIGQGLSMGIGAAVGRPERPTFVLVGDGGLMLNAAELPTAIQEDTGLVLLVMNDRGYGILRNLANEQFGGRRVYCDLHTPNFEDLARAYGYRYRRISSLDGLADQLRAVLSERRPAALVEFDMNAIGPFARPFAGPKIEMPLESNAIRNVLFIMCDQLRADHLSCYGGPVPTPHLDGLAARGVCFANAFVNGGVCGPSRTSYYTGRHPVSHRVSWNRVPLPLDELTLGQYLHAAGRPLYLLGKTHAVPDRAGAERLGYRMDAAARLLFEEAGFTPIERYDGHVEPETGSPYRDYLLARGYDSERPWTDFVIGSRDANGAFASGWQLRNARLPARVRAEDSETAYLTQRAIGFIGAMGEQPWTLHLSYIKPHWPFKAPAPYNDLYAAADCAQPVRSAAEREREHPVYAAYRALEESVTFARDDVWRTVRPVSLGLVKQIDDELGRLFAQLDAWDRFRDTLIVFTSDHGDLAGDHWLGEKEYFYESVMRVPLIVVDPAPAAAATRGAVVESFAESVDIVPTVLEGLGLPIAGHRVEGRSLLPQTRGTDGAAPREAVFGSLDYAFREARLFLGRGTDDCNGYMVRTGRYKYIAWNGYPEQLFDLADDPHELDDRGRDPALAAVRTEHAALLSDWLRTLKRRTSESSAAVAARTHAHARMMGIEIGKW